MAVNYDRVILFTFAGRKANMQLQRPFIERLLEEHPEAEYHIWNLARDPKDADYLTNNSWDDRTIVGHEFYGLNPGYNEVYQHYTDPEYQGSLFIKLDDDIVFIETKRFADFLEAITHYRGRIMTANIVNNGACTPIDKRLWSQFETLGVPLLDVHESNAYAQFAHQYFFDHHQEILDQPVELVPTGDWLSIPLIGYDSLMAQKIAETIGTRTPPIVSGRPMAGWGQHLRDEGVINTLPKLIMRGFTAAHLGFGPQKLRAAQLTGWRKQYREIGRQYLDGHHRTLEPVTLPKLSPFSQGVTTKAAEIQGKFGKRDWRTRWIYENETGARK